MDMTALARTLLEPIPAHRTAGIEVLRAADGAAEVVLETPQELTNVIGSLHSSGLMALVDAAGLGAIIACGTRTGDLDGIVPLGTVAKLEFLAPARGRLVAACRLTDEARHALQPLLAGESEKARLSTQAEVTDAAGTPVCRGSFDWSVRRMRE
ncbi:PaaI family thioesterase [Streptomyces sp. NPDC001401]|uniref:PaaI family thioesterase n=1 Tax=Streptomyces sp. NPDC001401 TaxID=3364570 RepID=UPI003687259A